MQTKTKLSYNQTHLPKYKYTSVKLSSSSSNIEEGSKWKVLFAIILFSTHSKKVLKTGVLHDAIHNYIHKKKLIILFCHPFLKWNVVSRRRWKVLCRELIKRNFLPSYRREKCFFFSKVVCQRRSLFIKKKNISSKEGQC